LVSAAAGFETVVAVMRILAFNMADGVPASRNARKREH
jgi:hypothetical protein